MFCTSMVSCIQTVCQPYVLDVLYVTRCTYENYVDGYRKLPEDREGDSNAGNLPN